MAGEVSAAAPGFFKRWGWRLDFLMRESNARAARLEEIIDVLGRLKMSGETDRHLPVLLIDAEAEANFIRRAVRAKLIPSVEVRIVVSAADIDALESSLTKKNQLFVAGSLFARHHMLWIEKFGRETLEII